MTSFASKNKAKINFETFMSDLYSLDSINTAMQDLAEQKVLRAIVKVSA
jgi:Zn-dependent alcohol dehydrogenase